jgi:hypothetical protein
MALVSCGGTSGHTTADIGIEATSNSPITARPGAVVVDGCVLDTWQRSTLATPGAKRMLQEVIMLCLVPREDGTVGPRDPSARAAFSALAADLKADGYRVHFGIAFTDESGARYDGMQTRTFLGDPAWRKQFTTSLVPLLDPVDGVEIDLEQMPGDASPQVVALFQDLAPVIRPARQLDVFVPPSVTQPSDLPSGGAFPLSTLAQYVDRMRVMTLDFSDANPGPTIDPGWAVDAARLAAQSFANIDIAYPLYGTDFGPRGRRTTTYDEAEAIAADQHLGIQRGPTGAPFVHYSLFGESHEVWFDDAFSTGLALGAWTGQVLPPSVGVVYYGLGAEEPTLFGRLAPRMQ